MGLTSRVKSRSRFTRASVQGISGLPCSGRRKLLREECHSCNPHPFSMRLVRPVESAFRTISLRPAWNRKNSILHLHPASATGNQREEYSTEYKSPADCFHGTNQRVWPLYALYLVSDLTGWLSHQRLKCRTYLDPA